MKHSSVALLKFVKLVLQFTKKTRIIIIIMIVCYKKAVVKTQPYNIKINFIVINRVYNIMTFLYC